eukprot:g3363.t1
MSGPSAHRKVDTVFPAFLELDWQRQNVDEGHLWEKEDTWAKNEAVGTALEQFIRAKLEEKKATPTAAGATTGAASAAAPTPGGKKMLGASPGKK